MGIIQNIVHENRVADLSKPELIEVSDNLIAAKFELMKFLPAKRIIDAALERGDLKPGGEVYESSSGTFALALSIVCAFYGLRLKLVTGPVSDVVRWRLENLGAQIHVVEASGNCFGGIQQARLNVLHSMLEKNPDAFWPQQYTNPLNSRSYLPVATDIHERFGEFDFIVGAVGSGGSLFGFTRFLRAHNPSMLTIAVDHNRSVIFGAQAPRITKMCRDTFEKILAMGASIPMGNVRYDACDEVHWVPVPKMIQKVHEFHNSSGYLVGPSSGAALAVGQYYAEKYPSKKVLTILPDHGVRYADTMFNPKWLNNWTDDLKNTWETPSTVSCLSEVTDGWCKMPWLRKNFVDHAGHEPAPRHAGYNP